MVLQSFYALLQQEEQELYSGCDFASSLHTTAMLLIIKTSYNVTRTVYDEFVSVIKYVLPRDNQLPSSFYELKKLTKKF